MDKCTRCSKPITSGAIITIDKPVYKSRLERSYRLCGYCVEDLVEFLSRKEEESIEYFKGKLSEAISIHEGLKNGTIEKSHSYSLSYASKDVRELKRKVEIAELLWAERKLPRC